MQELKKILEEIEKGTHTFELLGRDVDFVAIDWVRDVIRKYMNDDNEIMEQCPYCENEAALHWDVEKDGHQVFCPNCGKPMMLCSMCDARDGAVCDWKEGEGCKHSDERYRDYFRKHMDDGWIPVEKDLPKNESEVWVVLESTYGTVYRTYSSARYLYFENYGESYWWDNHYGYLEWDKYSDGHGGCSKYKVIAWQPIEPYHPERSDNHDGE